MASLYGYIIHEGIRIDFPRHLKIAFVNEPALDPASQIASVIGFHPQGYTLNPSCLSEFFCCYEVKDHALFTEKGIVQAHQDQILHVNLTRNIKSNDWAKLLRECKQYNVTLKCHLSKPFDFLINENMADVIPGADPSRKRSRKAKGRRKYLEPMMVMLW